MTQESGGKIRISIKDDRYLERSFLITGASPYGPEVVRRLQGMGLVSRSIGTAIVASGRMQGTAGGSFSEFGQACTHQTILDATRHSLRNLVRLMGEFGITVDIHDEPIETGFLEAETPTSQFGTGFSHP